MAATTWRNLGNQARVEDVITFLSKADIGSEIFGKEEMIVKDAIFNSMSKYKLNSEVQLRAIQLLQDWQVLSPKGITNEELAYRFDVLLQSLSRCIDQPNIVCNLFEFLAMVADRKTVKERCAKTEETELIHLVGHALEMHPKDKHLQRAGLQLYEAILNNATEKSQKVFAKKIFRAVGENLQKNNDDPAICFSSYSILCTLTDKMGDKMGPWIDRILGMVLTTITQLFSAELVAKCMLLLEKMATDEESLYVMAAHPRCLLVFTDALGILSVTHMSASVATLEYLLRILEDETSMHIVEENLKDQHKSLGEFYNRLCKDLDVKSERFAQLVAEAGDSVDAGAMEYWLQLLEGITGIVEELVAEHPFTPSAEAPQPNEPVPAPVHVKADPAAQPEKTSAPTKDAGFAATNLLAKKPHPQAADAVSGDKPSIAPSTATPPQGSSDGKSAGLGPVRTAAAPAAEVPTSSASTASRDVGLIASIAEEQARVKAALDAVSAAEAALPPVTELPHRRRSFVYEEPDPSTAALESAGPGGSHKDRVVGTPFTSLATVASMVVAPSTKPGNTTIAVAAAPVVAVAVGAEVSAKSSKAGMAALAAGIKWDNLAQQNEAARVEAFLHTADVATALLTKDPLQVKAALFDAMANFSSDAAVQLKCIQLLQDAQLLSSKGVTSEELSQRFDLLLLALDDHMSSAELICTLFEFLAMVADRKAVKDRCARTEDSELIGSVSKALEQHRQDRTVQLAGLQLYEAILNNASEKSQKVFAKKIFKAVGENLQKNNDDPAICFTSYSILCTLTDKMGDKLAPWIERILGLVLGTITKLFNAELVAKCLQLLEKLAVDHDSLFVMAAHPRCLLVFTDALGILNTKYMNATVTALEYLLRILEDETAMSVVIENLNEQKLGHMEYFVALQAELGAKSDKFLEAAAQEGQLDDGAMQYWLQLLEGINNILVEYMAELRRNAEAIDQAAVTPGLLPTIAEHGGEDENSEEEESVAAFDERVDIVTMSSKNRATKQKAAATPAAAEVEAQESFADNIGFASPEPDMGASMVSALSEPAESSDRSLLERASIEAEEAAEAAALEAEAERQAAEEEQQVVRMQEEQDATVGLEAEAERLAAEEEEARMQADQDAATALEAEAENERLAAEEEAARLRAEQDAAAALEAEAEAERLAAEEEAARLQAEQDAAAAAALEAEAEAERLAAEEEEARLQAELDAAAALEAEAEAERLALEEEEARLQADLAAIEEAEARRLAEEAVAERVRAEEEARRREADAAAAAKAQEAEAARLQAQRDEEARAAAELAEKGRVAAAVAAAEKKRQDQLAAARLQQEKEEAVHKAAAEKAEKERVLALAEAERRAQDQAEREAAARRAAAEKAEQDRLVALAEAERRAQEEAEREAAARRAAAEKAEAERLAKVAEAARLAREQAEAARRQAEEEEAARRLAAEQEEQRRAAEAAEAERVLQAQKAAEAEKARVEAERQAAERIAEEQRVARLAAERAAARVAAEKEAQRERAAQAAAVVAARLAAAEAAKALAVEKRNARLAAEKVAAEEAEARRLALQKEREERMEAAKAARAAAAQQALAEARERTNQQRIAAEAKARADAEAAQSLVAAAQAAVAEAERRKAAAAAEEAIQRKAAVVSADRLESVEEHKGSEGSTSASFSTAIEAEVVAASSPVPAPTAALTRNDSWRSAKVPFHRSNEAVTFEAAPGKSSAQTQPITKHAAAAPAGSPAVASSNTSPRRVSSMPNASAAGLTSSSRAARSPQRASPGSPTPNAAHTTLSRKPSALGSPSPVRSTRTPPSSASSSMRTPHSAASGSMSAMDSMVLDLATPQVPPPPSAAPSTRRSSVTAVPKAETSNLPVVPPKPASTHSMTAVPMPPTPHRPTSPSSSTSFERARSPLLLTRQDPTPLPPVSEDELLRREARSERLSKIQYPISASTSPMRPARQQGAGVSSKQQQAIDGMLEAFAQLSVPSTTAISSGPSHLRTSTVRVSHASLRDVTSRSPSPVRASSPPQARGRGLLHSTRSGRFLSPSGSPSRRTLSEMERLYEEVVSAAARPVMQRCGDALAVLFRRLHENNKNSTSRAGDDQALSVPIVKSCIKKLDLLEGRNFTMNDAQILLSRLGVKHLTVFGFAMAVTLCAERSLCSAECDLAPSSDVSASTSFSALVVSSYLTVVDFLYAKIQAMIRQLDAEHVRKSAFNPLDEYKEITPEEQAEVMTLLEREKKVFFTIYESYLPGVKRAFADIKAALNAAPLSGGLPFSGVVAFSRDFELSPELLSRPQLLEIFNSILLAERELLQRTQAAAATGDAGHSQAPGQGQAQGQVGYPHRGGMAEEKTSSSAQKMSGKPAPLAESISFPQFLDFILMVALRCPMFRGPSPAVVKLSNLLLLLNQSRGKHKIDEKFRWKELVVFKVNPVFAMAANHQSHHGHGAVSAGSGGTSAGRTGTTQAAQHAVLPPPSPSSASIPISPASRTQKPTTVPYYDAETQSVVQIRRKKPMAELRGKLSTKS